MFKWISNVVKTWVARFVLRHEIKRFRLENTMWMLRKLRDVSNQDGTPFREFWNATYSHIKARGHDNNREVNYLFKQLEVKKLVLRGVYYLSLTPKGKQFILDHGAEVAEETKTPPALITVIVTSLGFLNGMDGDQGRTLYIVNNGMKLIAEFFHNVNETYTLPDGWYTIDVQRMGITGGMSDKEATTLKFYSANHYTKVKVNTKQIKIWPRKSFDYGQDHAFLESLW